MEPSIANDTDIPGFTPFTKTERIKQLNEIDKSLNQLLNSAGHAIQTLSATRSPDGLTKSDRRRNFEENCNTYLRILQSVDVGLHRQIYGLEESEIIPADKSKKEKTAEVYPKSVSGARLKTEKDLSTLNEGIGKHDVGLLNSQNGRIGRDMEADLWEQTKLLLEEVESKNILTTEA